MCQDLVIFYRFDQVLLAPLAQVPLVKLSPVGDPADIPAQLTVLPALSLDDLDLGVMIIEQAGVVDLSQSLLKQGRPVDRPVAHKPVVYGKDRLFDGLPGQGSLYTPANTHRVTPSSPGRLPGGESP